MSAFFGWAVDHGHIESNPVRDFKWPKDKAQRDQGTSFEPEELRTLFSQPIWTGCHPYFRNKPGPEIIKDSRYWLPLIGLYSGMRLGEIAQLHLEDLKKDGGIWYFDIEEDEDKGKRVKTAAGTRVVPVHPELIRVGLLDHWEKMKKQGEKRMWPDLKPSGPDGSFSDYASDQFRSTRAAAGLTRHLLKFHSFRRAFATALHNAEVSRETMEAILGHASGSMSIDRYSSGLTRLDVLYEAVCRVQFDIPDLVAVKAT